MTLSPTPNRPAGIMGSVFLPSDLANSVLSRQRRDNSYLLEEIRQGNIQRECREEICTYEEAREAFENDEKTLSDWLQQRFWEEYVRESSPGGGLQSAVGGVHSLYLILPLLLVLLLIAAVAITVWRCHSRKRSERSPALGVSHRDPTLSVVSMDQWGRDFHDHSELSVHSSPAYPGSEVTSARGSRGEPPPSYEEAVGHTDVHIETEPPPQYEDIIGHGK
ncbi:transmembrane gamma-carboxyglutamic acid protein 1 isoform X1 [Oncorhynchus tshawytscha]|uniref:Gla domain-containing protein n=2 Tax=Oncorhynchus tshawytscha TaxID=74940 RepID=A0AAZ3NZV6_ONCTS|nr:transmembrane gamma-carboxyglutamic acid protein 1 isoform X1 [Oncorhynchus tshawytscha]